MVPLNFPTVVLTLVALDRFKALYRFFILTCCLAQINYVLQSWSLCPGQTLLYATGFRLSRQFNVKPISSSLFSLGSYAFSYFYLLTSHCCEVAKIVFKCSLRFSRLDILSSGLTLASMCTKSDLTIYGLVLAPHNFKKGSKPAATSQSLIILFPVILFSFCILNHVKQVILCLSAQASFQPKLPHS